MCCSFSSKEQASFNFMAAVTIRSDFGAQENKVCRCFPLFPHLFAMKWWSWIPWSFFEYWVLSQFFHSLLSPSSRVSLVLLSFMPQGCCYLHIRGYWYFLPAILILACASSSLAFLIMYSAYKLKSRWQYTVLMYSFPSFEPVHCSMSCSDRCFLACIQVSQGAGKVIWFFHLIKNFPQFVVIHTVKIINVVNEA